MDVNFLRESRQKGVVAFTKFCQDIKGHEDCIFCFFEGEDVKYYGPRIEQYTEYSFSKIINYNCNGREEVEKVFALITKKTVYDKINKMFFIDKDYLPSEEANANLYQTPCYSIENFYSSVECFGRIINREFGINTIDADYNKCICDYTNRLHEFHNNTSLLNIWLYCQRLKEESEKKEAIILSDFKMSKLFSNISIKQLELKKPITIETLKGFFPNAYEISNEQIDDIQQSWKSKTIKPVFRGKFELEFLRRILESLITENKSRTYFSRFYKCVRLSPGINMLSSFSTYADTPNCLVEFLTAHRIR